VDWSRLRVTASGVTPIAPPVRALIRCGLDPGQCERSQKGGMSVYMMSDDVVGIIRRSRRFLHDCPAIAGRKDRVAGHFY
jgi:hypothetical protein